jgi:hypothetical protein
LLGLLAPQDLLQGLLDLLAEIHLARLPVLAGRTLQVKPGPRSADHCSGKKEAGHHHHEGDDEAD